MKRLILAVLLTVLCSSAAQAQTYRLLETYNWLPASSDNVCALVDSLSVVPNKIILWSASDIRLYVGDLNDASGVTEAQAAVDSLCNHTFVAPAAGLVIDRDIKWLLSPARADTVVVQAYKLVRY